MRSNTIILAISLLAAPLSLLASPDNTAAAAGFPILADVQTDVTVDGRVFTPAPVPSLPPPGISPVDRVAGSGGRAMAAGPVDGTPFSDEPSGSLSDGGTQISSRDRVDAPADGSGVTPNLGR